MDSKINLVNNIPMPKAAPAIPEEKKAPEIEENTEEARKKS